MKDAEESKLTVYELGVEIVPSIAEEEMNKVWESIKGLVSKAKAEVVSEEAPNLIELAYTMVKNTQGKNAKFDTAYFGWIKFEVSPLAIKDIEDGVEGNVNVLRSMIIKTVRENTLQGNKFVEPKENGRRDNRRDVKPEATETSSEATSEAEKPIADAEVDKAINNLVAE